METSDDTTITISGEVAGLLMEAVAAGGNSSSSDAIRDAMISRREEREHLHGYMSEDIDQAIDEADASGPAREIDVEDIKREGFRRAGMSYPET